MKIVSPSEPSCTIQTADSNNGVPVVDNLQKGPGLLEEVDPVQVVYCSWDVCFRDDGTALAVRDDSPETVVLRPCSDDLDASATMPRRTSITPLDAGHHQDHEGWLFGEEFDSSERRVAITGVCLFDARWAVRFQGKGKKRYTFWNSTSRARVFDLLQEGYQIKDMFVPKGLGRYHLDLIQWIGDKLRGKFKGSTEKVLIHVPQDEYHHYLREFEEAAGMEFPLVHKLIDEMATEVKTQLFNEIPAAMDVQFINPYLHAPDPEASFLLPYEQPELFGVATRSLFGIEEFGEAKIPLIVQENHDRKIPTYCATVGFPKCYYVYVKANQSNSIRVGTP